VAWQALGRHMVRNGGGVLLNFGGDGPPVRTHPVGGLQAGLAAVESMRRQLATELGEHGVRVVTLRTGGIPEAVPATSLIASRSRRRSPVRRCLAARRHCATWATSRPSWPQIARAP
jgi:NAD(P)-dependent dehydrogenase (short-subunit alcohol dehydrogenase family)